MSVNTQTESDLSDWLSSDACTLEAVGWDDFASADVPGYFTGSNSGEGLELCNGTGRWPPPEVLQLEIASASGDLALVETILQHWKPTDKDEQINLDLFASSFRPAIKEGFINIGMRLIKYGITMNEAHFKLAMESESYQFLEQFLVHGFDINKAQGALDLGRLQMPSIA